MSATTGAELAALEAGLGYRFREPALARLALTHRSAANELGDEHYERLEFLGDAVLGLLAAEWLYRSLPDAPEGHLARLKSYLVSSRALAEWGRSMGVGELLVLGAGEERSGGRRKESLLADSMEAVLGAVFLDGGLDAARSIVEPFLELTLERDPQLAGQDAKSQLQESLQSKGLALPEYRLVAATGPAHERTFRVECIAAGGLLGVGEGRTKKEAERRAAAVALRRISASDG